MVYFAFALFVVLPFGLMIAAMMKPKNKIDHQYQGLTPEDKRNLQILTGGTMKVGTIVGGGILVLAINLAIYIGVAFVIGSVVTSGVKTFNNDCGTQYQIEKFVNGNFFCK